MKDFAIQDDDELLAQARSKASYADSPDEWPADQAADNLSDAKRKLFIRTGSDEWYTDVAYGQALLAMTALVAKAAVENINIISYGLGDETVRFTDATPEQSQQIQMWSEEVNEALDKSELPFPSDQSHTLRNTSNYIG